MPLTEEQARKRVEEERAFYGNLAAYLVVNTFLVALNVAAGGYFWAVWPLLGWGVGLGTHAIGTFGLPGRGRGWAERRVRELTGEAASPERLRALVDHALDERHLPASREAASSEGLQRRIEHLEAIVTSRDWDLLDAGQQAAAPPPAARRPLDAPEEDEETPEARAARLARRVR